MNNDGKQQEGPTVQLVLSCFNCIHCRTKGYTCQGDSGSDVFCAAADNRPIGDTTWATPDWCPYREYGILKTIERFYQNRSNHEQ